MKNRKNTFLYTGLLRLVLLLSLLLVSHNIRAATENKAMPWNPLLLLSDTVSNTVTITISGKATIPNYTPAGKLVVLVDGLDGEVYGAAMSDKDGKYFVEAAVPKDLQRVFVLAVDPNDPNYYTAAYVSLVGEDKIQFLSGEESTAGMNGYNSAPPVFNKDLDAASIAVSLVSDYSGLSVSEFGEEELMAVFAIGEWILQGKFQPRFCSQKKYKDVAGLLVAFAKKHINHSLVNRLKAYTRKTSDNYGLISIRLQDGGMDINSHITSSNWERNRVGPAGVGVLVGKFSLGPVGMVIGGGAGVLAAYYNENQVVRIRNMIDSFDFSSINHQSTGWTTQEHLEAAVTLIYHHGYGNCQEKGLVAAYFASLFDTDEFKQVAHVVAVTGKHSWFSSVYGPAEHSFAIACTEDPSVYDLQNLPDAEVINNRVSLPQAFYDAGCYLVDPWAQNMAELTRDEVDLQEWENILYVMGVYNRNQPKSLLSPPLPSDALTYFAQSTLKTQSCPVNLVCDVCSNRDAMNSKACQAWIPSQMLDPNKKYYYLFKRSGTGYRKMWGGYSYKMTGYDYFYQYILPSEADTVKENFSKFSEATAIYGRKGILKLQESSTPTKNWSPTDVIIIIMVGIISSAICGIWIASPIPDSGLPSMEYVVTNPVRLGPFVLRDNG